MRATSVIVKLKPICQFALVIPIDIAIDMPPWKYSRPMPKTAQ